MSEPPNKSSLWKSTYNFLLLSCILFQMYGSKTCRILSISMHPPKACRRFNWNAALTRCRLNCRPRRTLQAWYTRGEVSINKKLHASWKAAELDHWRWNFHSINAKQSKTAMFIQMLLLFNMIVNLWQTVMPPSKSNVISVSHEVFQSEPTSKPEMRGE